MLTFRELVAAVYGASLLARFDAAGMRVFDISLRGFWRSFMAAVLVAPLYAVLLAARPDAETAGGLPFFVVTASAYVIHWVAFPLLMVTVTRLIDREQHYLGYIVAYNWSALLQNAVFLPLTLIALGGALGDAGASLLTALVFGYILAYDWFVTRTALGIGRAGAAALVMLALGLDILIGITSESLLRN